MNSTEALAQFVAELDATRVPTALIEQLRLHVFDTIGAAIAGAAVAEARDVRALVEQSYGSGMAAALGTGVRTSLPAAALLGSVAARCSEVDDIHLRSCVTPGAIVVPTALAAAGNLAEVDVATLLAACLAGYEIMLRFGVALDGPHILYRGIWPTYLCTGFGVVATLARLWRLEPAQIADALGLAATLAVGTTGRPPGRTSRWLTIGAAAQNGVLATLAAQRGLRGDASLLDGSWSAMTGVALDGEALLLDLGREFFTAELSLKPWCAAKQTIAATQAFRAIVGDGVDPGAIQAVVVEVPPAYAQMIDRLGVPTERQASFASVRYQLALAAFAPERAFDVERSTFVSDSRVARLIEVTRVAVDDQLAASYPSTWPARVRVCDASGAWYAHEVQRGLGDPGTPYGWREVEDKFTRITGIDASRVGALAERWRTQSLDEPAVT